MIKGLLRVREVDHVREELHSTAWGLGFAVAPAESIFRFFFPEPARRVHSLAKLWALKPGILTYLIYTLFVPFKVPYSRSQKVGT